MINWSQKEKKKSESNDFPNGEKKYMKFPLYIERVLTKHEMRIRIHS